MPYNRDPYDDFPTAPKLKEHFDQANIEPPTGGNSGGQQTNQDNDSPTGGNIGANQNSLNEVENSLKILENQRAKHIPGLHLRPDDPVVPVVHKTVENEKESKINSLKNLRESLRNELEQENPLDSPEPDTEPELDE